MRYDIIGWGLVVLLIGSACSNGVKYRVDRATIADLPLSERDEVLLWQGDRDRAQGEIQKAKSDIQTAEHAIATAKTERR